MPLYTATPARIRRSIRAAEFARFTDNAVLARRPDAKDGYASVRETFWDDTDDAQVMVNELAAVLGAERMHEAFETSAQLDLGGSIALTPQLPRFRMLDRSRELDRVMTLKGMAKDLGSSRVALEVVG